MSREQIVMFSGGAASYCAAKRVADRGPLTLVFTNTRMEDWDLYRFLHQAVPLLGGQLVFLEEGRDPWQVFFDVRFLGNTRIDPCSRMLKREPFRDWLDANRDPAECDVIIGYDYLEEHRVLKAEKFWAPWHVVAPMLDPPYLDKLDMLAEMRRDGLTPPLLYALGFHHNNCGGFYIKAGQGQFLQLLRSFPQRYAFYERQEQKFREYLGADVAILRDRTGGKVKPLTTPRVSGARRTRRTD